jgi:hypothetical protein
MTFMAIRDPEAVHSVTASQNLILEGCDHKTGGPVKKSGSAVVNRSCHCWVNMHKEMTRIFRSVLERGYITETDREGYYSLTEAGWKALDRLKGVPVKIVDGAVKFYRSRRPEFQVLY